MSRDKVRFEAQERVDKVDADALQELVYGYTDHFLGALFGRVGGVLSPFSYTDTGGTLGDEVTLSAFQAYWSEDGTLQRTDGTATVVAADCIGRLVTVDPAEQATAVDTSAARALAQIWLTANPGATSIDAASGSLQYVWMRPVDIDEDTAQRRQWDIGSQRELPVSIFTRTRQRAEFEVSATSPVGDWVRIGKIADWDIDGGGTVVETPQIINLSIWDDPDLATWTKDATAGDWDDPAGTTSTVGEGLAVLEDGAAAGDYGAPPAGRFLGVAAALADIRRVIRRLSSEGSLDSSNLSYTATSPWNEQPFISNRLLSLLLLETHDITGGLAEAVPCLLGPDLRLTATDLDTQAREIHTGSRFEGPRIRVAPDVDSAEFSFEATEGLDLHGGNIVRATLVMQAKHDGGGSYTGADWKGKNVVAVSRAGVGQYLVRFEANATKGPSVGDAIANGDYILLITPMVGVRGTGPDIAIAPTFQVNGYGVVDPDDVLIICYDATGTAIVTDHSFCLTLIGPVTGAVWSAVT